MENLMENVKELFSTVEISVVISYTIAFASIILSLLAYFHSKRTQKPRYLISSASLKNEMFKDSSISLRQGDKNIPNLTISKFALWNTGITLNKSDIAEQDPIRITTSDDVEILEVQDLCIEKQNNFKYEISEDKQTLNMSFDYFAKNQGVVLKIFHTGAGSFDLSVKGALKNGMQISRSARTIRGILQSGILLKHVSFTTILRVYGIMFVIMGIIFVLRALLGYAHLLTNERYSLIETILIVFFGVAITYSGWFLSRRTLPAKLDEAFRGEH